MTWVRIDNLFTKNTKWIRSMKKQKKKWIKNMYEKNEKGMKTIEKIFFF